MKDYVIKLLDTAIEENKVQEKTGNYDIALLKEIIGKVDNNKDYLYEFILDLNGDLIKDIISLVTPDSAKESFLASIIYLKNLLEINKKEDVKIPLSKNQEEILYELLELIKKIVEQDDLISKEESKKVKKNSKKYQELKDKLENNKVIDVQDYNLVEELVRDNETENVNKVLNEVVDFLNSYNLELLPEFVEEIKEEPIIEEKNEEVQTIETTEEIQEPISTEASVTLEEVKNDEVVEPEEATGSEEMEEIEFEEVEEPEAEPFDPIEKEEYDFDIFSPHSFNYDEDDNYQIKIKRKKKKIKEKESAVIEEVKEDTQNDYLDRLNRSFTLNNISGKASISKCDNQSVEELFNYFKEQNFSEETINDLINRCTQIFFTSNKNSFIENAKLAISYNADLEKLIKNNITYFYNSPEYNKNKINLLEKSGININLLFDVKPQILAIGLEKLLKNIELIKSYGLTFSEEDYDSLSIIASANLAIMLDTFIETGFSTYFVTDGLKNTRSLIIKRIFYAHKNNLNVWSENIKEDRINSEYESWIKKERRPLTEEEIIFLVSDYSILESLEESKRPVFFTDANNALIRRKYEFKFGNLILSRLKTYSIFKLLIEHNVPEKEALVYALTYNSNLDDSDYMLIKNEILGK